MSASSDKSVLDLDELERLLDPETDVLYPLQLHNALLRHGPDLIRRLREAEARVAQLEEARDGLDAAR